MATLTIKHGARPRYLPKKITNYTYVERGDKRVLDYTYTETDITPDIAKKLKPPNRYPSEAWGLGDGFISGSPTGIYLVMQDGQPPNLPHWEYAIETRTYNRGTEYEFEVPALKTATLMCGGTTAKSISFNDQNAVFMRTTGDEDGGSDYHDYEPSNYTLTAYESYPGWTKKTGDRGNLHTFWERQLVKTRVVDDQTIYYLEEKERYELITTPALGTPVFSGGATNTAYNCEVKLELKEE